MRNHTIYSKAVCIICIIVLCISISSCSAASPTSIPTLTPIPTLAPTPTLTLFPTPTLTPTPVPTLSPEQQEDLDMQAKLTLAPDIEGTNKVIKEINGLKRVTYEAIAGNRFGLKAGSYAGEYKKEVTFEGNEIGGIALVPKIAEKILLEQIAKQTDEQGKWLIPLPVDISDMKTLGEVKLELSFKPFFDLPIAVKIDCNGETIDVVNVMPGKTTISQLFNPGKNYTNNMSILNDDSKEIISGKEMEFLVIATKFIDKNFTVNNQSLMFGDVFGKTSGSSYVYMSCSNIRPDTLSFDKVFKTNGFPVFVESK